MKIYNSLTEKNEDFLPFNAPHVLIYTCGIASQSHTHLEHTVAALRCTAIRRYLSYKGYEVILIDNDVSDNSFKGAIDIHCGDHELLSSRHEREKVQCKAHDNQLSVKYWMRLGVLKAEGVKIHKSSNNLITLEDGLEKYGKELITWVVLRHHYRSSIDLNDKLFRDNLNILRDFYIKISPSVMRATIERSDNSDPKVKELFNEFEAEMDNDFNTPGALILLTHYLEEVISLRNQRKKVASKRLEEAIVYLGRLLGLFHSQNLADPTRAMLTFQQQALRTPEVITVEDIDLFIKDREEARANKEFAKADHICNLLKLHGIAIIDGVHKNRWKFTAN